MSSKSKAVRPVTAISPISNGTALPALDELSMSTPISAAVNTDAMAGAWEALAALEQSSSIAAVRPAQLRVTVDLADPAQLRALADLLDLVQS